MSDEWREDGTHPSGASSDTHELAKALDGGVSHRNALQLALEAYQVALHEHCTDSLEADKLAIRAHHAAMKAKKPDAPIQPWRFGGD